MFESLDNELIQSVATLAAVIGIVIAIFTLRTTINQFRRQQQLSVFSEYTKRYQDIILNFPENINESDFNIETLKKEVKDKTLRYMRAYFDLCSEEYYLQSKGSIDKYTWNEWKSGIQYAFTKSAFIQGWSLIKPTSDYYPEFRAFIDPLVDQNHERE